MAARILKQQWASIAETRMQLAAGLVAFSGRQEYLKQRLSVCGSSVAAAMLELQKVLREPRRRS